MLRHVPVSGAAAQAYPLVPDDYSNVVELSNKSNESADVLIVFFLSPSKNEVIGMVEGPR